MKKADKKWSVCGCVKAVMCKVVAFAGGYTLGQLYYYYLLQDIPLPGQSGKLLALGLSILLGLCNVVCQQLQCISMLLFPMYCGKPGRGVLKAMILTYIVYGPITNMGLNAKEVVRVFACSTLLAQNISEAKYELRLEPTRSATLGVGKDLERFKETFRYMKDIIEALEQEIEVMNEIDEIRHENNFIDDLFAHRHYRSDIIKNNTTEFSHTNRSVFYESMYRKKLQLLCDNQLSHASAVCVKRFKDVYMECFEILSLYTRPATCWRLIQKDVCDLVTHLAKHNTTKHVCEPPLYPGLGKGYEAIKRVKVEFVKKLDDLNLQQGTMCKTEMHDIQDAKETAMRVQQAFEEKAIIMHHVLTIMNIFMAVLFLRIFNAAIKYHDLYLTSIDYDNVFITGYFKKLDARRGRRNLLTLLPMKKMERKNYIDVFSWSYKESQRSNLILQTLKVFLEVVTATTFVMLDRLFFEALEVVRQHAEIDVQQQGTRDLDIQVEGTGILASMLRNFLNDLIAPNSKHHKISNAECLPRPRQMPYIFFFKIYGGYTWIIFLLFANPYTLRLKRLICSYFYPRREKERILHLYNDILKKRMKIHKTLRRRIFQSVRAHYLTGDAVSLLNVRLRFPHLLGWLRFIPAARMTCVVCGETLPCHDPQSHPASTANKCPFVYCAECWREVGARCLACEPCLAELSDVDSYTDDEFNKYEFNRA